MSESALKFQRRQIRRAFGSEAIDAMTSSMSARDSKIAELDAKLLSLGVYVEGLQKSHDLKTLTLENRIARLEARRVWHREFWRRS